MFVPVMFSKYLNEKNLKYSIFISKFTQKMKEYMVAYPTIKNYSIESNIINKFDNINEDTENAKFEADYLLNLANSVGVLIAWFMQFIAVGIGLMLVIKGEILIGTVISAQSFAGDLAAPLQRIVSSINSIRSVKEIVKKIESNSLMLENQSVKEEVVKKEKTTGSISTINDCEIKFDDVCLEKGNKNIIHHFSFTFESGKKYLIVGVNGSGKSTIFKLLKKWFRVCSGNIFIDNQNILSMSNEEISQKISYLNEQVSIFSGSVNENISLFREYDDEDFQNAINIANVQLDLERIIQDEGSNISSGEQRRIEIARSLLKSVKVLIFDEVVSTLDIETAYEIEKLALNFKDKTVIFISHNFSGKLIQMYDEILVMDNGRLLAHGNYNYLIKTCEYFKRICEIKFGQRNLYSNN